MAVASAFGFAKPWMVGRGILRPASRYMESAMWEFPKIRGTLFGGPYNKDPSI